MLRVLGAGRLLAAKLLPCRLSEAYLVELLLLWLVGGRHGRGLFGLIGRVDPVLDHGLRCMLLNFAGTLCCKRA